MNSLPSAGQRLLVFLTLLSAISGCSSGENGLRLSADDITALNRVYEVSPWVVRQSKLNFQVREGGVVEINIQGDALRKPDKEGQLWLPIVLVRELPEYFQASEGDDQKPVELESYRVPGGLWMVTAVVGEAANVGPAPAATPSTTQSSTGTPLTGQSPVAPPSNPEPSPDTRVNAQPPINLKLRVLMVSPQYSAGFPFLVPVGHGHANVDTSITLPNGTGFSSLEVKGSDEAVSRSTSLTILPASISGKAATAAGRLSPESGIAWNFSGVTYAANTFGVWRPWFLPSAMLIVVAGLAVWWRIESVGRKAKSIRRSKVLSELQSELENSLALRNGEEKELGEKFESTLAKTIASMVDTLAKNNYADDISSKTSENLRPLTEELKEQELKGPPYAVRTVTRYRLRLARIRSQMKNLEHLNRQLAHSNKLWGLSTIGFWVLFVLFLSATIWLLSTFAQGQTRTQSSPTKPPTTRMATLGELGVTLEPQDPHSNNYDKVNVALSFFPLTDVPGNQSFEEISIGTGNSANLSIEPVQLPVNSQAKIIQENGKVVRINVPTSYAPMIQRLKALAEWRPVEFSPPPDYFKSLDTANKVNINYVIKGAQTVSERTKGGFFHWFPWDTMSVELPLELRQPAIVSSIELQRTSLDYVASPSAEGLTLPFVESESGRNYQSSSKEKEGRTAIWADKLVTIRAKFERKFFQRIGLTVGQVIGALVIAGFLGWWTKAKTIGKFLVTAFVFISFFWAFRTVVLNYYSNLPTIVTVQGITLFETLALANVVLIFGIGLLVRWKLSP
jgi:hypothetical protein